MPAMTYRDFGVASAVRGSVEVASSNRIKPSRDRQRAVMRTRHAFCRLRPGIIR